MSVAVFVTNEHDARAVIPWGARFAAADGSGLLVIAARKSKGKPTWTDVTFDKAVKDNSLLKAISAELDSLEPNLIQLAANSSVEANGDSDSKTVSANDRTTVTVREIASPDPEGDFAQSISHLDVGLLIMAAHEPSRTSDDRDQWIYKLLAEAPCETLLIRGRGPIDIQPLSILVATQGESDTDVALERARQLAEKYEGRLSLLFVRPDDDRMAIQVAHFQLDRLNRNVKSSLSEVPRTIVLHDNFRKAIQEHCQKHPQDLVVVGTDTLHDLKSVLRPWDAGIDLATSVAVIRAGVPFSNRIWNAFRIWLRSRIPQLDREGRIRLVDRLQSNSRFDFDFIALTVLSTMIAALGLVQNSGAVVIGAMLIAPLMNPLAAIGFALAMGNIRLIENALRSIVSGFAVALVVAIVMGLSIPISNHLGLIQEGLQPNSELEARGHPNLLDWFVAFVSGVAAAYAMGRPKLLSALPGVAIAAALIPPIATSGLAIAMADWWLSLGAFLLFLANIVAIVLGTTVAFWSVGISSRTEQEKIAGRKDPAWPIYLFAALVIASILVAGTVSMRDRFEHEQGKIPTRKLESADHR